MKKEKKVIHILMTDYQIDSRVRNETNSLYKNGYDVDVYCLKSYKIKKSEDRENINLIRFGLVGNKLLNFLSAYIFMFVYSLNKKIDLVHAHDANALPIAYLISCIKRVPFIYDSHELWSESHHSISSKFILKSIAYVEKKFAKKAQYIITVSDSIKEFLQKYFKTEDITVIRNIPSYTHEGTYNILREEFKLSESSKVCLYQGVISQSRGVELILTAAINVCSREQNVYFFFLGEGPYLNELKKSIKDLGLSNRIITLGRVEQSSLLKYTKSADIGIHAITNSCLNHDYCLPNKIFEYIHSGVVPVVTNLYELNRYVIGNDIGLSFEDNNAKSLENQIMGLLENEKQFLRFKSNVGKLAKFDTWDNESKKLVEVYQKVLS
ncbi:glycosyltransferase family 4 protein [Candidatus Marinarcus aquaticus]|uniref:Glycosyltransferase n=1 Tax=Candidatus Marinarcus aquaticus TaxID=2044504 RepID=A0A4Q0XTX2_9BACT|nr:glycosyltransferase family 4 protein [Candidatus Marinarcus aquaticus]RXJ57841.1 hypothetical protein CRV04_04840 [Candidatus Marinarcus aquaticus]